METISLVGRSVGTTSEGSARGAVTVQAVFVVITVVVTVLFLAGRPAHHQFGVALVAGAATLVVSTAVVSSAAQVGVPHSCWLLPPVLDLVAVALIRTDLLATAPSVAVLAALPALWLGAHHGRLGIWTAGLCGLGISTLPFIAPFIAPVVVPADSSPAAFNLSTELGRLVLIQLLTTGLAMLGHLIVRELLQQQEDLQDEVLRSHRRDVAGRAILNAVDSAVWLYDARGRLMMANHLAHTMAVRAGYDLQRPDQPGTRVWRGDGTPVEPSQQLLRLALATGDLADTTEWSGPAHDMTAMSWHARRTYADDGSRLGTVIVAHDITPHLVVERTQERFLATVSHELRTPLTSISGFVEVAETTLGTDADPTLRRSLSAIRRNSDRLCARVAEILTVAQDRPALRRREVDLTTLLASTVARWRDECRTRGLRLDADLAPEVVASVDPDQIQRVAEALLANAARFTPSGGEVRIKLDGTNDKFVLQVADTGCGMSAEDRSRAFEGFHRGENARDRAAPGLGLGLLTVRRVIEEHHGSVTIASEPGSGTTVTVRVPYSVPYPGAERTALK